MGLFSVKRTLSRVLTVCTIILEICLFAVFFSSIYTLSVSLQDSLRGEGEQGPFIVEQKVDPSSGGMTILYSLRVRNRGLFETSMLLKIKLLSQEGRVISEGTDLRRIAPGSSAELKVTLLLSKEDVAAYFVEVRRPRIAFTLDCRTFYDLFGMGLSAEAA